MDNSAIEKSLIQAMEQFDTIDCHEHLPPEGARLATTVDVFTLFSHYCRGDLHVAGMTDAQFASLSNRDISLQRRWEIFEPFFNQIKWASYARAAHIAAKKFYGIDEINAKSYEQLTAAMQAGNKPGIYERVLKDACKIRTCLTQCGRTDLGTPLLTPLMPIAHSTETWAALSRPQFEQGVTVRTLDDYLDLMRKYVLRVKSEGAVGLKMLSNPYKVPSRQDALEAFASLRDGKVAQLPQVNPLRDYVWDETIAFGAQQDLVIAVHTGYWGDFRTLDPLHMIPILSRHPNARFDIYHLGYPWVRECLMLGKGFANVWLNLCWTHVISQRCVQAMLDEAVDLIPMNKILGFGGDYGTPVEKVYGHLVMAREDIAKVLGRRVAEKQMTENQAVAIARQWLCDNPKELYRLK